MNHSRWEQYYLKTPLDEIPWQKTQADYFTEVINQGKIELGSALDLGCGTGTKSIYLAQKGFKVTGIDISKVAIKYARKNAKKAKVKVDFIVADATDLSFLEDEKFDFVLDWANLHGIPEDKRENYILQITKHIKKGGKLLLRCFSKDGMKKESVVYPMGRIYLFLQEDIKKMFGRHFKILEINRSKPFGKNPPAKWFNEYLMEKL